MKLAVFGGATGIGAAVVRAAASVADRIIIADTNFYDAVKIAEDHKNISVAECDAMSEEDVSNVLSEDEWDTIISTVGGQIAKPFEDLERHEHAEMWRINYWTAANIVRYATFHLYETNIVLVSSIAGITSGGPGLTAYGAAKAATISLTKTLAQELAPNFRINCVCPGWTDTPFNDPVIEQMGGRKAWERAVESTVPLRRAAGPDEIARVVFDVARWTYTTGAVVVADGGLSL